MVQVVPKHEKQIKQLRSLGEVQVVDCQSSKHKAPENRKDKQFLSGWWVLMDEVRI
jgi:hypothetical protein